MFRVSTDRIDSIRVYLVSSLSKPVSVMMGLRQANRSRDFAGDRDIATAMSLVPARHRGWVTFRFDRDVTRGGYYWFHMPVIKGMRLRLMAGAPPGSCRAYHSGGGRWHASNTYYAFVTEPVITWPGAWGASNVVDGVSRTVGDDSHMWVSDPGSPLPQWIELDLGRERRIGEIRLTFDSDFGRRNVPEEPSPKLVRDYRVLRAEGDKWVEVVRQSDNILRHRVHRFDPVRTQRIRVEVRRTRGSESAHIFEIRLYE